MLYETILSKLHYFLDALDTLNNNQLSYLASSDTSISVPYHMNEELIKEIESKYTYTNNKSTTEVLVLWRCSQINHILTMICHIVFNIP